MLTIKIIRETETTVHQASSLTILDEKHDELKAHIADCNIKSANLKLTDKAGEPVRHDDMKAALFTDDQTSYLYPGDRCYVTSENGQTIHSLNFTVKDKLVKGKIHPFEQLIAKLAIEGGCIISSADCSELEIADARCRNDFYATEHGHGYVRRAPEWLQKHSRFARGAAANNCEAK